MPKITDIIRELAKLGRARASRTQHKPRPTAGKGSVNRRVKHVGFYPRLGPASQKTGRLIVKEKSYHATKGYRWRTV